MYAYLGLQQRLNIYFTCLHCVGLVLKVITFSKLSLRGEVTLKTHFLIKCVLRNSPPSTSELPYKKAATLLNYHCTNNYIKKQEYNKNVGFCMNCFPLMFAVLNKEMKLNFSPPNNCFFLVFLEVT